MAPSPTIRLDAAALATTSPILPHQQAAWNWLQERLTEPDVGEFAELFRADPAPRESPTIPSPPVWPPGMVGPKIQPTLATGDHHLIANDISETMTTWSHDGRKLWTIPCLCRGQGKDNEWQSPNTDTPPGLYKVGSVWRDYERLGDHPATVPVDLYPYGWFTLDLVEMEGQERRHGRAGIAIHGGGSALGSRGCWQPFQPLVTTHGCIRVHNADLRDKIVPLLKSGTIWVSVLQEAG